MGESDDFVLPRFFALDRDSEDGHNALLLGAPGEGKTTLLQYLSVLAVTGMDPYGNKREKQAGLWRARKHDKYLEFFNLGLGKLMFPNNASFSLYRVRSGCPPEELELDQLEGEGIDYGFYEDAADLVNKLEVGKILCIMFPEDHKRPDEEAEFYTSLFEALKVRKSQEYVHLVVDEIGDLFPLNAEGRYALHMRAVKAFSDFRKTSINSVFAAHSTKDLDYRFIEKLKYRIYKAGSKKIDGDAPDLRQKTINFTPVNAAWFVRTVYYDQLLFPDMKPEAKLNYKLQTVGRQFVIEAVKS